MTQTIVRVVAAVVSDGEKFLVCQRPMDKRHGGLWEFPGGKCEPGESDLQAVRRELAEELGVTVTESGDVALEIRDPGSPFLIVFVPVRIHGDPVPREHMALHWGTPDELVGLRLAPSDKRFVETALANGSKPRNTFR